MSLTAVATLDKTNGVELVMPNTGIWTTTRVRRAIVLLPRVQWEGMGLVDVLRTMMRRGVSQVRRLQAKPGRPHLIEVCLAVAFESGNQDLLWKCLLYVRQSGSNLSTRQRQFADVGRVFQRPCSYGARTAWASIVLTDLE